MGKAARSATRRLGKGNGSAIPGLVTLAIDPDALAGLVAEMPRRAVMVTGSNGKGTTCRMLAEVMRAAGLRPVINPEGSNQQSGIATTMVAAAGLDGHLPADPLAAALFEVDEGSLPEIVRQVSRPGAIVVTNLFRDQLDRYFEPAYVTAMLERCIRQMSADTALVLNADDPRVACLAAELPNPRIYFGIADTEAGRTGPDPTSDYPRCPRCGGELTYSHVYYAHLGHWACAGCGLQRPDPHVRATKAELVGAEAARLQVVTPTAESVLQVPLPGLYNAYNALAAVAAAVQARLPDHAQQAIEQVRPGSLRMERIDVAGRDVYLVLAKNANGYTEVLRAVLSDGRPRRMLLGLNTNPGKQPDTSWIWDVDFDALTGLVIAPVLSGNRAEDLAVRLKYAGWIGSGSGRAAQQARMGQVPMGQLPAEQALVEPDPVRAFRAALAATPPGEPLWVVSTSVVLGEIRRALRRAGYVRELWQEAASQQRSGAQLPQPAAPAQPDTAVQPDTTVPPDGTAVPDTAGQPDSTAVPDTAGQPDSTALPDTTVPGVPLPAQGQPATRELLPPPTPPALPRPAVPLPRALHTLASQASQALASMAADAHQAANAQQTANAAQAASAPQTPEAQQAPEAREAPEAAPAPRHAPAARQAGRRAPGSIEEPDQRQERRTTDGGKAPRRGSPGGTRRGGKPGQGPAERSGGVR
jgi:lipid II isoglutaminyl synthase (glutamine-hydrolysing)